MLALVMDQGHACLLVRQAGRWRLPRWDVPAGHGQPLAVLRGEVKGALGLELPGPAGQVAREGAAVPEHFVFVLPARPEVASGDVTWRPLAEVAELVPVEDADLLWDVYQETMLDGFPAPRDLNVFCFGGSPAVSAKLLHHVVLGRKRATSSWLPAFEALGERLPRVGELSLATDAFGLPRALLETVEVRTAKFRDVGLDVAAGEGEGDWTLADWQDVHRRFFTAEAEELGLTFSEDDLVFSEFFRLVRVLGPRH